MSWSLAKSGPAKILIIEDDPADADLIVQALVHSDDGPFAISHAVRLADVPAQLEVSKFDVFVVDLDLPDSSGPETVKSLRLLAPEVPMVVVSGEGSEETRVQSLRFGAVEFLSKTSTDEHALAHCILRVLGRTRHRARVLDIVDSIADATVVINSEGTIDLVNRAAIRLFGRAEDKLIGARFGRPVAGASGSEIAIVDRTGGSRTCELRSVELNWDGEGAYLVSIRDITDRVRAFELEKRLIHADRLASIGQLAAGVVHEINNPAAFIQTNCTLMLEDIAAMAADIEAAHQKIAAAHGPAVAAELALATKGARIKERLGEMGEMLQDCDTGIKRIGSIVRDLGSFSRIEREEIVVADLNEVITVASSMVRHELRHHAKLVLDLDPLPPVAIDYPKFIQVLVNLLVNASHATEGATGDEHSVTVRSRFANEAIAISVEDTGSGIDKATMQRIFEPFFTTKTRDQGTGLGLPLAAETIRKHGGEMFATSEQGRGALFEIRLPVDTGLRPPENRRKPVSTPAPTQARILVVDDEPLLRKAFCRVLGGHEVIEVDSAEAALGILTSDCDFDVIISDLMMPGMGGAELFRHICEIDSELATRVVFVTGGAVTQESKTFILRHEILVLEKPVSRVDLLGVVDSLRR